MAAPALKPATHDLPDWILRGELILNCGCTVFCPCVISLGKHPPTEGTCQAWIGVRIEEGHFDGEDIGGLNIGMLLDIPGHMGRGNWKAAAYIDERASEAAYDGLVRIFSGKVRGTTGLFSIMVSEFLGAERAPVVFQTEGRTRRLMVGKKIQGEVTPVAGLDPAEDIVVRNTGYWMGPDVIVAEAGKGRVRAHGRVWDFDGRSAEICHIDWHGPT